MYEVLPIFQSSISLSDMIIFSLQCFFWKPVPMAWGWLIPVWTLVKDWQPFVLSFQVILHINLLCPFKGRALLAESCIRLSNLSEAKYLPSLHFLQPSHYTNINTFCLVLKYARRLLFVTPNNIIYTSSRWLELSKICEVGKNFVSSGHICDIFCLAQPKSVYWWDKTMYASSDK